MALPNPGMDFDPLDVLTAAEVDDIVENVESLAAGTGLNDGVIPFAKLASTIFSGALTSYVNPGTGGGNFKYINLGGIKIFFGITASQAVGTGAANFTVTLPASFFSTIDYVDATYAIAVTDTRQFAYIGAYTTSTITLTLQSLTNGSAQQTFVLVIGT